MTISLDTYRFHELKTGRHTTTYVYSKIGPVVK